MWEASHPRRAGGRTEHGHAGAFAVEFGVVVLVFFLFVFGVIELARLIYVWNTVPEVTRRAARGAANTDFKDSAALAAARHAAIFRDSAGGLAFAAPITDEHIRIDYLAITISGASATLSEIAPGALPASAAQNRLNCTGNPNGANCISLVRVRMCDPRDTSSCTPVRYAPLMPLFGMTLSMPTAPTILPAGTLGYFPGMPL